MASRLTRPSMFTSIVARAPDWLDCDVFSRARAARPAARPSTKSRTPSVRARVIRYGRSNLAVLYPVMQSGSDASTSAAKASSMLASRAYERMVTRWRSGLSRCAASRGAHAP